MFTEKQEINEVTTSSTVKHKDFFSRDSTFTSLIVKLLEFMWSEKLFWIKKWRQPQLWRSITFHGGPSWSPNMRTSESFSRSEAVFHEQTVDTFPWSKLTVGYLFKHTLLHRISKFELPCEQTHIRDKSELMTLQVHRSERNLHVENWYHHWNKSLNQSVYELVTFKGSQAGNIPVFFWLL